MPFLDIKVDSLFGNSLLMMCGDRWRAMRSTVAPAFTSTKIRSMFDSYVGESACQLIKSMVKQSQQSGWHRCEVVEFFGCYAANIIASCVFSLKINAFENPTNEFFVYGKAAPYFSSFKSALRLMLLAMFPKLLHAIDFEYVPKYIRQFYKSAILGIMNERTKRQISRPDLINTLMQVRNERLKKTENSDYADRNDNNCNWSDDELIAQCFICFLVGSDSLGKTLAFMAYELALNHEIQQKLYEEIRMVNESLSGGRLTCDALSKLKYLDQVIDETLRKWPPALFTTRRCVKDVVLDLGDGKKVTIERGMGVWIPTSAVHNDPRNFSNPSIFDPERFNEENKPKIKAGSFLSFGIGPRSCVGNSSLCKSVSN